MANAPQLSKAVAATLLDKLGTDDQFRALFLSDPAAALEKAGASKADAEHCVKCLHVTKLADKAAIKTAQQELMTMLTSAMGFVPHRLGSR